jgi:hypothetical protein
MGGGGDVSNSSHPFYQTCSLMSTGISKNIIGKGVDTMPGKLRTRGQPTPKVDNLMKAEEIFNPAQSKFEKKP